ncbi:SPOR domain-containing protein [Zunongwangia profunda]|uniref:SPOR domain-containing protein n=1 Tax=Zunongwangia profunda TaxID=398743 RepID=UPI001D192637|nr:SPOR domain-containing protein [Zunongwangia profunda]MCC4227293.1 SPOR domain-containing protein [Zunongwangia profunda]|tara:strand:+ start:563 stop:952 length:390 start_codon:yes stop_codon:yes gene_type:complete
MNILSFKNLLFGTSLCLSCVAFGQEETQKINISQSDMINELSLTKTKLQKSHNIGDRYVIQLFSGPNGDASNKIKDYEALYDYPARIKYEAPNYKVWIGNFRNRLEADRALLVIKETYPSAFIPKPERK